MNNHRNRRRAQQRHDAECSVVYAFFVLLRWGKCLRDKKKQNFAFTQLHLSHFFSLCTNQTHVFVDVFFCLCTAPLHLFLPLFPPLFLTASSSQGDESGSSEGSNIFASVPRLISFPNGRHRSMAADRNGSCGTGCGWKA